MTTQQQTVTATGRFGRTISFDGKFVTIGKKRDVKTYPISQISGVDFKPYSLMGWGFLEVETAGNAASNSRQNHAANPLSSGQRAKDAAHNPNAVTFGKKSQPEFEALQAAVLAAL
jgi:hypothetical protein